MKTNLPMRWFLLRGLTRESAHWGEFIPKLQAAFPDAAFHAVDLPGTGEKYRDPSPATIGAIMEKVRLDAEENGWLDSPIHLLAISLGGMVAWDWLQTYPDDIKAAVLINASMAGLSPFYHRLRWQCYPSLFRLISQKQVYEKELAIIKLVSNRPEIYEPLAQEWAHIQRLRPVSPLNAFNQLLAAARYRPEANPPRMPVLLLNSKADRLVSPRCTESIAEKWHLPYVTHPWGGHELCLDDGDWVVAQAKKLFAKLLRDRDPGSGGARNPHVLCVHSGSCAPSSPD